MAALTFPLKKMIDILKTCQKYMDIMYLDVDGNIKGRKEEDALGEYLVVPDLYDNMDQMRDLTPLAFNTREFLDGIKNFKAKKIKCWKCESSLYVADETENSVPAIAEIPTKRYYYPEFVENVWKRAYQFNYRKLTEDEMADLNDYKATILDAYYSDDNDPIQIIVSGKDFELKKIQSISIAAVDKFTQYQEDCDHNHIIMKMRYPSCDVFMLCGVV